MKYLLTYLFLLVAGSVTVQAQKQKTILAIFAHPDDESAIGEVLTKYAQEGHRVFVVIATNGKDGTRVTSIPAGDSLGKLRQQESICACNILGIRPPIFLSVERLDTKIGVGNYFKEHKKLLKLLEETITSINPDVMISFGPDGDTHHAEHIVVGSAVAELLLMKGWVEKYPLYYLAWTKEQGEAFDLGYVNEQYRSVKVSYSQEDENRALESMKCYVTQYTPEELVVDREKKIADNGNFAFFRKFVAERVKKVSPGFF